MAEDIDQERNNWFKRTLRNAAEWAAVIIATLALFVTILNFGMSTLSVYITGKNDDKIESINEAHHEELLALEGRLREDINHEKAMWSEKYDMTQAYIFSLKSKMVEHGIEVPEQEK